VHDFTYSYNEPMTENYFWHPAYDDYPVVGVTWSQAKAFNVWRTQNMMNAWLQAGGEPSSTTSACPPRRNGNTPRAVAWTSAPYPWGGPYIRNRSGCFLGNFKPLHGNYTG
jgi:sulfatase modifying factor 1